MKIRIHPSELELLIAYSKQSQDKSLTYTLNKLIRESLNREESTQCHKATSSKK
jgi:hypothetical protein